MHQIGESVGLAFPCHRDRMRFERLMVDRTGTRMDAGAIVEWTRASLYGQPWSQGFKYAFGNFERRYRAGERLLADHPFWLFFVRSQAGRGPLVDPYPKSELTLAYDVDDRISLRLSTQRRIRQLPLDDHGAEGFTLTSAPSGLEAATRGLDAELPELVQAFGIGVLPFVETSWGCWTFDPEPDAPSLKLLVHARLMPKATRIRGWIGVDDDWRLSEGATLDDLAALSPAANACSRKPKSITLIGGVKSGKDYLGRPGLLPSIAVPPDARLEMHPARVERGAAVLADRATSPRDIVSIEPLRGIWRVSASERDGTGPENEVQLSFVDNAYEHEESCFARPKDGWRDDCELILATGFFAFSRSTGMGRRHDAPAVERGQDLLEAVYAGGRHGWAEANLIPLLDRFATTKVHGTWDIVRSLQEGGWIEPLLSTRWGIRRWDLRPPVLVSRSEGEVVTDGAWCSTAMARLSKECDRLGAEVTTMAGPSVFSVPITVIRGIAPRVLASMADFALVGDAGHEAAAAPSCWPIVDELPTNRTLAATWCWKRRHFVGHDTREGVRLERWTRSNKDLHDLYRVRIVDGPERTFANRSAAIIEAHRLMRQPLFEWCDGLLTRTSCDGYLPATFARALRRKHLASPGPTIMGGRRRSYVYPCDHEDLAGLRRIFGIAIEVPDKETPLESMALSRRLGTRGRALFNGRFATSHPRFARDRT